jgi:4-hydroxy-tetrahydrodipicolinate synthase
MTSSTPLTGSIVALVTPMHPDGTLDTARWTELLDWHAASGTRGVVVAGTTGESATLSEAEFVGLLKAAVEQVGDRLQVIAGTGSASTAATIERTQLAAKLGAHTALVVTPSYNRPPQRGLQAHYLAVAEAVDLPIILYNVPGRTAVDLLPETALALAAHPRIVAIKEAVADVQRVKQLVAGGLPVLSGDDGTAGQAMLAGASGVVSVAANVCPSDFAKLAAAAAAGQQQTVATVDQRLAELYDFLGIETNPIPAKWLLAEMGRIEHGLRSPLVNLDRRYHAQGQAILKALAA